MGDSKQTDVTVEVDFGGISYDPLTQTWTVPPGTPVFTAPAKTKVKAGKNTIKWTVQPTGYQSGFVPSMPSSDGIEFGSDWTFGDPKQQSALVYTVEDDFDPPPPMDTDYEYTINVRLTSETDSSIFRTFSYDPEVENESTRLTVTP